MDHRTHARSSSHPHARRDRRYRRYRGYRAWLSALALFVGPLILLVAACKDTQPAKPPVVADISSPDAAAWVVVSPTSDASTGHQVSTQGWIGAGTPKAGKYKLAIDQQSTTCTTTGIDAGPINAPGSEQTFGIQIRDSEADGGVAKVANVPVVFDNGYGVARFNVRLEKGGHGTYSHSHTGSACSYQSLHAADLIDMSPTRLVLKVVSTYGEILGSCPTQPIFSRCNREVVLTYTLVKAD